MSSPAPNVMRDQRFKRIYDQALALGRAAGIGLELKNHPPTQGEAYIIVKPGNSAFCVWLKQNGLARQDPEGGLKIDIVDYNQSMERKSAHAQRMACALRGNNIKAIAYDMEFK